MKKVSEREAYEILLKDLSDGDTVDSLSEQFNLLTTGVKHKINNYVIGRFDEIVFDNVIEMLIEHEDSELSEAAAYLRDNAIHSRGTWRDIIDRSFSWGGTEQGFDYWSSLADGRHPLTDEYIPNLIEPAFNRSHRGCNFNSTLKKYNGMFSLALIDLIDLEELKTQEDK